MITIITITMTTTNGRPSLIITTVRRPNSDNTALTQTFVWLAIVMMVVMCGGIRVGVLLVVTRLLSVFLPMQKLFRLAATCFRLSIRYTDFRALVGKSFENFEPRLHSFKLHRVPSHFGALLDADAQELFQRARALPMPSQLSWYPKKAQVPLQAKEQHAEEIAPSFEAGGKRTTCRPYPTN